MERFIATFDLHYGHERRSGHKIALHDPKAWAAVMKFAQDFKPHTWIHGGDMLDCGVISHHNHGKPGATEGMKLLADATEGRAVFITPVEQLIGKGQLVYIVGNHEDWLTDLTEQIPSLEGLVDLPTILSLKKWTIVPQGGAYSIGKLSFIHGDQLKGGESVAKAAVIAYERSIRFGHFHTYAAYSKTAAIDYKNGKTGISVPCLCTKSPKYGAGAPNKWMQGFNFGWVNDDGTFTDYIPTIINGSFIWNGRRYKG